MKMLRQLVLSFKVRNNSKKKHERNTSDSTIITEPQSRQDENDSSYRIPSSSTSSLPTTQSSNSKVVRFATETPTTITVPCRHDLDATALWWQAEEMKQSEKDLERFIKSCRGQMDKCPWFLRDKHQKRATQDLQHIVRATRQILQGGSKPRVLDDERLEQELCAALGRASAVRSIERCLLPSQSSCHGTIQQHVRMVCRAATAVASKANNQTTTPATTAAQRRSMASSAASVRLTQVLGRFDALQAKDCWRK